MDKKITISNKSKIVAFFDELNKTKEETRKKIEAKMIKAGLITNSSTIVILSCIKLKYTE